MTINNDSAEPRLPLTKVIFLLFVSPSIFRVLQYQRVLRTLAVIMLLCTISGSLISIGTTVSIKKSAGEWRKWLKDEVKEFGITKKGEFFWLNPQALPYLTHIEGWQINFAEDSILQRSDSELGPAKKGLWISRDSFYMWLKFQSRGLWSSTSKILVEKYDLGSMLRQFSPAGEQFVVKGADIDLTVDRALWTMYILTFISNIATVGLTVVVFTLFSVVFSFIPLRMSTARDKPTFNKFVVINLYSSIPPILIATVYSALNLPGISFFTIFLIAYFCYHLYIIKTLRELIPI